MVNTIKNVKITITAMYSTQTPPFIRVVLRPPPVAEKGSIALFEITSIRKCVYAQRDTTIF